MPDLAIYTSKSHNLNMVVDKHDDETSPVSTFSDPELDHVSVEAQSLDEASTTSEAGTPDDVDTGASDGDTSDVSLLALSELEARLARTKADLSRSEEDLARLNVEATRKMDQMSLLDEKLESLKRNAIWQTDRASLNERANVQWNVQLVLVEKSNGSKLEDKKRRSIRVRMRQDVLDVVEAQSEAYDRLCASSPHGTLVFTSDAAKTFVSGLEPDCGHRQCYARLPRIEILRHMLIIERYERRAYRGDKERCPDVVALRFLLAAWGPTKSRELVEQLKKDADPEFNPVDEVQLARLEWLL